LYIQLHNEEPENGNNFSRAFGYEFDKFRSDLRKSYENDEPRLTLLNPFGLPMSFLPFLATIVGMDPSMA
jgi:hypothetical protein